MIEPDAWSGLHITAPREDFLRDVVGMDPTWSFEVG